MALSTGCDACNGSRSCGNHHLYVIELDTDKCLGDASFTKLFGVDVERAYYVGRTKHTIECRYNQHSGRKKGNFSCSCFTDEPVIREKHKRVKFIQHHLKGGLRPNLSHHFNPAVLITDDMQKEELNLAKDAANRAEAKLTEELNDTDGVAAYSK